MQAWVMRGTDAVTKRTHCGLAGSRARGVVTGAACAAAGMDGLVAGVLGPWTAHRMHATYQCRHLKITPDLHSGLWDKFCPT